MRRLLSAAAIAALSIGLLVPAADAATTTVTSYNYVPSDWDASSFNCTTGVTSGYSPAHVADPAAVPGNGSLMVSSPAGSARDVVFGLGQDASLSQVTAFAADIFIPGGSVAPEFSIDAFDGGSTTAPPTHLYSLSVKPSGNDSWVSVDATSGLTVTTGTWNAITQDYDWTTSSSTTDLATFVSGHPGAQFAAFDIALQLNSAADCVADTFYLDNVHYVVGSSDNTVDFEAPTPTSFSNGSHPSSVLTGTAVTLSATLKTNGVALANQTVGLYLKGTGSKSYKLVKTLVTNSNGAVSYKVAPSSTTSYQWRFASSSANQYAPANASAFTITTRQRVTIGSKPTSVSYRGTATIKGRVTPHKSGVTVRLVRIVSGKRIVVASARTTTGGYFTIKAPMTVRGTYSYVVTAVAYTGEAQGQSPSFKITTR